MRKIILFFFLFFSWNGYSQNVNIQFTNGDKGYFLQNQVSFLINSLEKGELSKNVKLSNFALLDDNKFQEISKIFNEYYPKEYLEGGVGVISYNHKYEENDEIKWIIALSKINQNKEIESYIQIKVIFEGSNLSEIIRDPRIFDVEISKDIISIDNFEDALLTLYKEWEKINKDTPSPPENRNK